MTQRWTVDGEEPFEDDAGEFVRFTDHEKATDALYRLLDDYRLLLEGQTSRDASGTIAEAESVLKEAGRMR